MGTFQKNLKVNIESAISSKNEIWEIDGSDVVLVSEINIPEPISMKSISPWRRTKSNIRILKDNRIICSSEVTFSDNGTVMDEVNTDQLFGEGLENSSKWSFPNAIEKPFLPRLLGFKILWKWIHLNLKVVNLQTTVLLKVVELRRMVLRIIISEIEQGKSCKFSCGSSCS